MTCKPILVFLKENGVDPTLENKKRWQAGWTLRELREGREFIREHYERIGELQLGTEFLEKHKKKYGEYTGRVKRKKKKIIKVPKQFTEREYGVDWKGQMFILSFFRNHE